MSFDLLFFLMSAVACLSAALIARAVYKRRVKTGKTHPGVYQVVTFILSFIVLFGIFVILLLYNLALE